MENLSIWSFIDCGHSGRVSTSSAYVKCSIIDWQLGMNAGLYLY